jgi:hypothetical protein
MHITVRMQVSGTPVDHLSESSPADLWAWIWTHIAPYMPPLWMWQIVGVLFAVVLAILFGRATLKGLGNLGRLSKAYITSRSIEDVLTVVAASIATGVSATGMWRFAEDVLHLPFILRVLLFAFIEVAIVTSAVRARRNMRENFSAGVDGMAVWALTVLTAVLSSMDARSLPEAVFRLAAPLVAAWLWERGMAIERHRIRGTKGIHWRFTLERVLVAARLAEASDRTAGDVDRQRWITRIGLAAKKAKTLRDTNASDRKQRAALAQLDKAFEQAAKQIGLGHDKQVQEEVRAEAAALYSVAALMDITADSAWDPAPADATEPEPHTCPANVVKVPITIKRVVEKQVEVERIVEVPVPVTVEKHVEVLTPVVPVDALDAARIAYEHSLSGPGRPFGQRTLAKRFGIEHRAAEEIIKSSQEARGETPAEAPGTAPAATTPEPIKENAQVRHSSTASESPGNPDAALTAWLFGTAAGDRQEAAEDRHSDVPQERAVEPSAADESTVPPAPVTATGDVEAPADDRHSTPPGKVAEEGREEADDEKPVTVPETPAQGPAVPSQRITLTPLAPVFQEPSTGQSVTVPEALTRPSHNDSVNAFDRAIAAAIAEQRRLPALNGARPAE